MPCATCLARFSGDYPADQLPGINLMWFLRQSVRPAVIYLASRIGTLMVAGAISYDEHLSLGQSLISWDSNWYLQIARVGYPSVIPPGSRTPVLSSIGFFPLLPLVVRALHEVLRCTYGQAGLLVTFAAGLGASVAMWWLIRDFAGDKRATRGTALVLLSPGAFVLSMVYTEGLVIALVACCLLALGRHRWLAAGLCAGLATAADPVAAAIVVPCLIASWQAIRHRNDRHSLIAPALAPAGLLAFFAYLWAHTGTPFAWFIAQRRGFQGGGFGVGVPRAISTIVVHGFMYPNSTVKSASFVVGILLLVLFLRARPPSTWVGYVIAVLAMGIISPVVGITPRLALRAFPLLGVVGARLEDGWFEIVIGLSALAMGALAVLAMGSPGFTP